MRDLRAIIADDSHAATFQSLGQYRTALLREIDAAAPEGAQPRCPDCNAAVLFECVACSAGNYPKPEGAQAGDEVLIAITRGEGYEDVHPQLVAEDALGKTPFHWRVVTTPPQPEGAQRAAWALAEKVRTDLDRMACPDTFMRAAVESVVANYATQPQPQDAARDREDAARLDFIERERVEVSPISGGGWDALRYGEHGKAETIASRWTLRAAIDAARAAGGGGE